MQGQYADPEAFDSLLKAGNPILYEVYEVRRPELTGEMIQWWIIPGEGNIIDLSRFLRKVSQNE